MGGPLNFINTPTMFAATHSIAPRATQQIVNVARRTKAIKAGHLGKFQEETFKQSWLTDPSCYPIMMICGGAVVGAFSFITWKFTTCGDVRVTNKTKGHTLYI